MFRGINVKSARQKAIWTDPIECLLRVVLGGNPDMVIGYLNTSSDTARPTAIAVAAFRDC